MSKAFIIVDVQPTFCEQGELPVAGGNQIASDITQFIKKNRKHYQLLITTQDWHISPGNHFSNCPNFVDSWPPHGIAGSQNAQLHPALTDLSFDASVKKGQFTAAYSGFEGVTENGTDLDTLLRQHQIDSVDIVGLALSHCVKDTALDAKKRGFFVRIIQDLSAPVSPELGIAAINNMTQHGIVITSTDKIKYNQ